MPLKGTTNPTRLTQQEALDILPDVVVGLLKHTLKAQVIRTGPGIRHVRIVGPCGFDKRLNIKDWDLLSDNILFDPEVIGDAADPISPPPPTQQRLYRPGSTTRSKGPTVANRRFNPRTPINKQLIFRKDGSYEALIEEQLRMIFV